MFFVSSRARSTSLPPQQTEMDIDNCFWNLDKEGVLKALNDVAERVRVETKVRGDLWCSIAKGGDKTLDHIGKGSENKHRTVNLKYVLKFVTWDVFYNTEFVFGCVVLAPGDKGVPIGGFLLVQLCVLWGGGFRELLLFDNEVEEQCRGGADSFSEIIFEVYKKWNPPLTPSKLACRGVLTFPQYVPVPKDKGIFDSVGMHGLVEPEIKVFGGGGGMWVPN